jgi:broad specificity phosphatase PhoE
MTRRSLFGVLTLPAFGQTGGVTVILVRHGDRDHGTDPDEALNALGQARAEELARVLGDSGVTQVFVTELKRTSQTAAPLVSKSKAKVKQLAAEDVPALDRAIRALPEGSVALVVSHGGRLEPLLDGFGHKVKAIAREEYDRMYFMTLVGGKSVALTLTRFGAHRAL